MVTKCLGVKMTGVAKCHGCKMSGCQNVLICLQWHNFWVAQCLGGKMSCCQNVSVSKSGLYKFLGVQISGAKIVGYPLYGIGLEVGNCPFFVEIAFQK